MSTDIKMNLGGSFIRKLGDDLIPINHGDWMIDPDGKIQLLDPELVDITAQQVFVYLQLRYGEYFVDVNKGFPYAAYSFYKNAKSLFDDALKQYILGVNNVKRIVAYRSEIDSKTRQIIVNFDIESKFGRLSSLEVTL